MLPSPSMPSVYIFTAVSLRGSLCSNCLSQFVGVSLSSDVFVISHAHFKCQCPLLDSLQGICYTFSVESGSLLTRRCAGEPVSVISPMCWPLETHPGSAVGKLMSLHWSVGKQKQMLLLPKNFFKFWERLNSRPPGFLPVLYHLNGHWNWTWGLSSQDQEGRV